MVITLALKDDRIISVLVLFVIFISSFLVTPFMIHPLTTGLTPHQPCLKIRQPVVILNVTNVDAEKLA